MHYDATEYFDGLSVFQQHSNQHKQLAELAGIFFAACSHGWNAVRKAGNPLRWLDLGCGDGSFGACLFDEIKRSGIPHFSYTGIDINREFLSLARKRHEKLDVRFEERDAFNGRLHECGPFDLVTGFNAVYFVQDWIAFRADIDKCLSPYGMALFIQNKAATEALGRAFYPDGDVRDFTCSVPVEVYFPLISPIGWKLLEQGASMEAISHSPVAEAEKENILLIRHLLESMGGKSLGTSEGQSILRRYKERLYSSAYGGAGKYVSDNILLAYCKADAAKMHPLLLSALKACRGHFVPR